MHKIVAIIFYILFSSTILSPEYYRVAIWIFIFVPFLDLRFLSSLRYIRKEYFYAIFFLSFIFLMSFDLFFYLKFLSILIVLSYLRYTYKNNLFYLYFFVSVNIVIGVFQYVLFKYIGVRFFDPISVGEGLYGDFAMSTGNTFAPGFLLEYRVSGLNREPGFFSSLIISSFVVLFIDKNNNLNKKIYYLLFVIGLIITFSKVTLAFLVILPIVILFGKVLDRLGVITVGVVFIVLISSFVHYFYYKTNIHLNPTLVYEGGSVFHRTIGYYVITDLNFYDLLFGVGNDIKLLADKLPYIKNSEWWGYDRLIFDNSGLSYIIINFGLISFCLILYVLDKLNVKGSYLVMFILLTISVNPLTSTSFVILSYFILFYGQIINEKSD